MKNILLVFILSVVFLNTCKYEPTGSDFTEVPLPDPTGISIKLNPNEKYLLIAFKTDFNFEINQGHGKLLKTVVSFNDKTLFSSTKMIDKFSIDAERYSDGIYKLVLESTFKSGSGSLADKLGAEGFILKQEWTIEIKKFNYNIHPVLISVNHDNGKVKLIWNKFEYQGFVGYVVKKYDPEDEYNKRKTFYFDTIRNPNDTVFYDKYYLGGHVAYQIIANFQRTQSPYNNYNSNEFSFGDSLKLTCSKSNELNFKISWDKCMYPENFGKYRLCDYDGTNYKTIFETDNINNISTTLDLGFFYSKNFYLDYFTKDSTSFAPYPYREQFTVKFPYLWESFSYGDITHCYNDENIVYYRDYQTRLFKYDLNQMKVVGQFLAPGNWFEGIDASDNNKYFTGFNGTYGETIYIVDPVMFKITKEINLESTLGYFMQIKNTSISNNGLMFVCIARNTDNSNNLLLLDVENNQITDSDTSFYAEYVQISASGKYAFALQINQKKLYYFKIIDKKLKLEKTIDMEITASRALFMPNPDKLVLIENGTITIYDCETFNIIKQFPVEAKFMLDIDYKTNRVLTSVENLRTLYVYDLENGRQVTKIINGHINYDIKFLNNTIITNGIYYTIEK